MITAEYFDSHHGRFTTYRCVSCKRVTVDWVNATWSCHRASMGRGMRSCGGKLEQEDVPELLAAFLIAGMDAVDAWEEP